ncbi:hypothetical protein DY245_19080 [Streptomyces inhibens]|uniref:DUF1918 domain-containing protein n=1 Tax=Streptomyces inhibens TaxID=2293571 RepID=A0A371Q2B4_STRIH|nr:hypothetical protein DY245_19080 [Streptomyces inhibens]
MSVDRVPEVGDEVEYVPGFRAVVTDIRKGVPYLRRPGCTEWPAEDSGALKVTRTRAERIADGDFR